MAAGQAVRELMHRGDAEDHQPKEKQRMQVEEVLNGIPEFLTVERADHEPYQNRERPENVKSLGEGPSGSRQQPGEDFLGVERSHLSIKDVVAIVKLMARDIRELLEHRGRVQA